MIALEHVTRRFGETAAVDDVSAKIEAGETFVLIGPSGCGKSTLLRTINRLVEPTAGVVRVDGKDIRDVDPAVLRRGIGYVIQEVGLFAHHTVRRNIATVPHLLGWESARIDRRVNELLELVQLDPAIYAPRFPRELSGGQRQRVGIARALAADPPIVLLDEPFGALDPITRERLQDEFVTLSRTLGKTFVIVTHDMFEAARLGHRIAVMNRGRIVQCDTPREIVRNPADEFVAALLGRHRYQLLLMTTLVKEAARNLTPGEHSNAVAVPENASVWTALERMGAANASSVRLGEQGPAYARDDLVTAASA
jgi:osmoprotectant transport system ATP-binding protein